MTVLLGDCPYVGPNAMKLKATYSESLPDKGLKVEAILIPITRGTGATVQYSITVWAEAAGYSTPIQGGQMLVDKDTISRVKRKLWEQIKP